MSLTTPLSVQKLQTALHDKAKGSPKFRFYALYDKVYREDVLAFAYECCKANRGAAGVDGQTFEDIEEYGVQKWLDELAQELKSRTYQPQPVRRVFPSTAGRLAFQVAPFLMSLRLSQHQAYPVRHVVCVCPSCTPLPHFALRSVSEQWTRWRTAIRGVDSSTPEVFAPVWVLLSQPINA